jgi:hypothetical protein
MSDRSWFHRPEDPGAAWADDLLRPLRRREADVDVSRSVMLRITGRTIPAPRELPRPWGQVSWAAALLGGFAALALLVATAWAMIVGGDEGARAAVALASVAARMTLRGFDHMAGVLWVFAGALLAFLKGAWAGVDALSPLVRGGVFGTAIAGIASIGISIIVFSRARLNAPLAHHPGSTTDHGGHA